MRCTLSSIYLYNSLGFVLSLCLVHIHLCFWCPAFWTQRERPIFRSGWLWILYMYDFVMETPPSHILRGCVHVHTQVVVYPWWWRRQCCRRRLRQRRRRRNPDVSCSCEISLLVLDVVNTLSKCCGRWTVYRISNQYQPYWTHCGCRRGISSFTGLCLFHWIGWFIHSFYHQQRDGPVFLWPSTLIFDVFGPWPSSFGKLIYRVVRLVKRITSMRRCCRKKRSFKLPLTCARPLLWNARHLHLCFMLLMSSFGWISKTILRVIPSQPYQRITASISVDYRRISSKTTLWKQMLSSS